jgi:hypothetical protein
VCLMTKRGSKGPRSWGRERWLEAAAVENPVAERREGQMSRCSGGGVVVSPEQRISIDNLMLGFGCYQFRGARSSNCRSFSGWWWRDESVRASPHPRVGVRGGGEGGHTC